jgi:hypothetical protein
MYGARKAILVGTVVTLKSTIEARFDFRSGPAEKIMPWAWAVLGSTDVGQSEAQNRSKRERSGD